MSSLTPLEANGSFALEMFLEPAGELELVTNPDSKMLAGDSSPASSDVGSLDLQSLLDTDESLKDKTGSLEVVVTPTTAGELELTTSAGGETGASLLASGDTGLAASLGSLSSEAPSSTVPEPVTLLLTAVGFAGLSLTKFRNRVSR